MRDNLTTIAALTERIGGIIGQLHGFPKATGEIGPLALHEAIDGALLLVGIRARRQGVRIRPITPMPRFG